MSGSPITSTDPAPFVTRSFSRSISPQGRNTEPVVARQFEQWQLNAATKASSTSYAMALQPQRPLNTTTPYARSSGRCSRLAELEGAEPGEAALPQAAGGSALKRLPQTPAPPGSAVA